MWGASIVGSSTLIHKPVIHEKWETMHTINIHKSHQSITGQHYWSLKVTVFYIDHCSSGSICHCRWRTLFLLLSLCLSLCLCLCHWLFSRLPSTVAASLTARLMISPNGSRMVARSTASSTLPHISRSQTSVAACCHWSLSALIDSF